MTGDFNPDPRAALTAAKLREITGVLASPCLLGVHDTFDDTTAYRA